MFDFLNKKGNAPTDVKAIRQQLLLFIKEQLKKSEGGEGASIKGLEVFVAAGADRHLYEAAMYTDDPQKFRDEVQRIADDFAIDLPEEWTLEPFFVDELPRHAVKALNLPVALGIATRSHSTAAQARRGVIHVISGGSDQKDYEITPNSGRIYIGRDKKVQAADGFLRVNTIAFPSTSDDPGNKFVSRSHAHIDWDKEGRCFCLYADEGGIPPRNKIKVQRADGEVIRLQTTEIGHRLEHGDQIILGETVLLEFEYLTDEES